MRYRWGRGWSKVSSASRQPVDIQHLDAISTRKQIQSVFQYWPELWFCYRVNNACQRHVMLVTWSRSCNTNRNVQCLSQSVSVSDFTIIIRSNSTIFRLSFLFLFHVRDLQILNSLIRPSAIPLNMPSNPPPSVFRSVKPRTVFN